MNHNNSPRKSSADIERIAGGTNADKQKGPKRLQRLSGAILRGIDTTVVQVRDTVAKDGAPDGPGVSSIRKRVDESQAARARQGSSYRETHPYVDEAVVRTKIREARVERNRGMSRPEIRAEEDVQEVSNRLISTLGLVVSSARKRQGVQEAAPFSNNIPRREAHDRWDAFSGDYADLAQQTLDTAAQNYNVGDGRIKLLGADVIRDQIVGAPQGSDGFKHATDYVGGVAAILWQAGFIQGIDQSAGVTGPGQGTAGNSLKSFRNGREGDTDLQVFQIDYDATNPLHRSLMGSGNPLPAPAIELEIPVSGVEQLAYGGVGAMYISGVRDRNPQP